MVNTGLFLVVILLANIMQGITGFAGTILAMPLSLMLVGYPVAKPVLNVLGLLSGVYVLAGHKDRVCWKELRKIVAVMTLGILAGIGIKGAFVGREQILYRLLGIFVTLLAVQGLWGSWKGRKSPGGGDKAGAGAEGALGAQVSQPEGQSAGKSLGEPAHSASGKDSPVLAALLVLAGIAHGIFVSGGPLLISYLTKKVTDKVSFRATISTVWVFLNTIILVDDIRSGLWNLSLMAVQAASVPFLLAGMFIGGKLYVRMSQEVFMVLTYILLFVSGISLLFK